MTKPFCFVAMPFGRKYSKGSIIDFDSIYGNVIEPCIIGAGLEPIRAWQEQPDGVISKLTVECLALCEFMVADLTTDNSNVLYQLGIRHALRPWSTILVFAEHTRLQFEFAYMHGIPYSNSTKNDSTKKVLLEQLTEAQRRRKIDSPLFQMIKLFPGVEHVDIFRDRIRTFKEQMQKLRELRHQGIQELREFIKDQNATNLEPGLLLEMFFLYRDLARDNEDWKEMASFVNKISPELAATVIVQEQLGVALNRAGMKNEAEKVLLNLIKRRGSSSETYFILGRIYKDYWETSRSNGNNFLAQGYLDKAINTYLKGFELDFRDPYPGIAAVTLMEIKNPPDPRRLDLIPVIKYYFDRRVGLGKQNYWDCAAKLEFAVIVKDQETGTKALSDTLSLARAPWELEATSHILRLLREAREERSDVVEWAIRAEDIIVKAANDMIQNLT